MCIRDSSYIEQVVEELRHRNCLVNGFLDGVSADYQGGVMQIHLKRGGLALLQSAGSDRRIREILRQEFGADIEVVFDGVTELEEYSKAVSYTHLDVYKRQVEYEYKIDASNGAVLKSERERKDDGDFSSAQLSNTHIDVDQAKSIALSLSLIHISIPFLP